VSVRLTGALVAALALLVVLPAAASAALSRDAQRVLDDYRADAAIAPCDHTVKTYRRTLRQITPQIEEQSPAFRPAVEAALKDRTSGKRHCAAPGASQPAQQGAGTGTTKPAAPPAVPAKPAPAPPAQPAQPAQPAKPAPQPATRAPAVSPAPTPAPTVAVPAPASTPAPAPASAPVLLDRPHQGVPAGLLIALGLLALSLLAVMLALAARRLGWGDERLAGARHAWGEAAYRAGGTWGDFRDWVRLGR
jgi:hypothetical protein